jgi:hypothetical protein
MSAAFFRGSPLSRKTTSAVSPVSNSPLAKLGLFKSINLNDESAQNMQESRDKTTYYGQMKKWFNSSELTTQTVTTTVSTSEVISAQNPQTGSSINIRPIFTAGQKKQQDKLERNLHNDFEDDHHNRAEKSVPVQKSGFFRAGGLSVPQDVDTNGRVTRSRAKTTGVSQTASQTAVNNSQSAAIITTQYTTASTVMSIDENGRINNNNLVKNQTR